MEYVSWHPQQLSFGSLDCFSQPCSNFATCQTGQTDHTIRYDTPILANVTVCIRYRDIMTATSIDTDSDVVVSRVCRVHAYIHPHLPRCFRVRSLRFYAYHRTGSSLTYPMNPLLPLPLTVYCNANAQTAGWRWLPAGRGWAGRLRRWKVRKAIIEHGVAVDMT